MINKSEIQKTRFFNQLKAYGFKKLIFSVDFLISIAVFIVMVADIQLNLNIFADPDSNNVVAIFAAASTLFAITLATLAIILSFSNSELMGFMRKHNKLSSILFSFWLGNSAYLIVLILSLIYFLINPEVLYSLKNYLYPVIVSLFVYALIDTFYLLASVIRFGYFMDIYEKFKD